MDIIGIYLKFHGATYRVVKLMRIAYRAQYKLDIISIDLQFHEVTYRVAKLMIIAYTAQNWILYELV